MPESTTSKPKRKAMFLGPHALRNLEITSARRRTERAAMEEALELLAQKDAQNDAMKEFVDWATTEWGEPSDADEIKADKIWAAR